MTRVLSAIALTAILASPAVAQDISTNRVAVKTDWNVFTETDPTECWGVSPPKETVNTRNGNVVSARRDEILLYYFFRPDIGVNGQVAFTGGYPFAANSTVNLNIDGTEFELWTEGEWAWAASTAEDAKIATAMKRGTQAIVTGLSSRGTTTKDTFSLLGFTAAAENAEQRCAG